MGPIDYTLDVLNPIEGALRGYALGRQDIEQRQVMQEREQMMGLRAAQEARTAQEFADQRAAAARQRAQAEAMQSQLMGLREMALSGNLTAEALNQFALANASTFDEFRTAFQAMSEPRRQADTQFSLQLSTSLLRGNTDAALGMIDTRIEAAENSGTDQGMQEAQRLRAIRAQAVADPVGFATGNLASMTAQDVIDSTTMKAVLDAAGQGGAATTAFQTQDQQLRAGGIVPRAEGGDGRYEQAMQASGGLQKDQGQTEAFRTVDQKLRAANIFPINEGGDGTYERLMRQAVEKGGDGFALTVDPTTGAVSFSQGVGAGAQKPSAGYVTVPAEGGALEQRVVSGSPAAQGVAAKGAKLDASMDQANKLVELVEAVRDDPELDAVTGFAEGRMATGRPSLSPEKIQARQDLIVKINQLQGNVFLQAYESLKGSGQITEIEGIKAEAAIARMNRTQGTPAFKEALKDFLDVISTAQTRIKAEKAGLPKETAPKEVAPKAGGRIRHDAEGNRIND